MLSTPSIRRLGPALRITTVYVFVVDSCARICSSVMVAIFVSLFGNQYLIHDPHDRRPFVLGIARGRKPPGDDRPGQSHQKDQAFLPLICSA